MRTPFMKSGSKAIPVLFAALLLALIFLPEKPARACWNSILIECFDNNFNTWPWAKPIGSGRAWRCTPNRVPGGANTWGIQEIIYSTRYQFYCDNDQQSAWCIGGPGTHDPDNDDYPANLNVFMTYGPINLENVVDARVSFSLLLDNENDIGDSIFWGADSVFALALTHVWYDTAYRNNTPNLGWTAMTIDLKDLHRLNGDSVSAIGPGNRDSIYVFWWFKSDNDNTRGHGAFVDDVIIQWDDGGIDLAANAALIYSKTDSTPVAGSVILGDSLFGEVRWTGCDGTNTEYDAYHVLVTNNSLVLVDTLIEGVRSDTTYTLFTPPWEVTEEGENSFSIFVDAQNQLTETSEANNIQSNMYTAEPPNVPPVFTWLNPAGDTLVVSSDSVMLRWEAYDPDDEAGIIISYDQGGFNCFGPNVPGGEFLAEMDGEDSLFWNLHSHPNNALYWPFAQIFDEDGSECIYAPFPIRISRVSDASDPVAIPAEFFLSQNYPNPFNPTTEVQFGIHTPGHVSLKVYDLLGREAATLIYGNLSAGTHTAVFHGEGMASGVYLYTLSSPEGTISKKMVLMK